MYFSVIDKITAWKAGDWIRAEKYLRADEPFLPDHFPGTPVMPGVLTLEAMAQAGDWLVQSGRGAPPGRFCLQTVRAVKFTHFARPGDVVTVSAKLIAEHADGAEFACQATIGDRPVASARMTLGARDGLASATWDVAVAASEASETNHSADTVAFRWHWLDRFVEFREGRSAKAVKRVPRLRPGYSLGRLFPEQLTAVLVLEGLAQTGGLLAFDAIHFRRAPIMAKIIKAEFHGETEPGTVLEYAAQLERLEEDGAVVRVASHCGQRLHAEAEILYAFVANEGGGAAVDPAIFYAMMCDTGAFDVPRQEPPLPEPTPGICPVLYDAAISRQFGTNL
jgi:3-hydroxyacyl-[acyl-carrier-protein] dehydratase